MLRDKPVGLELSHAFKRSLIEYVTWRVTNKNKTRATSFVNYDLGVVQLGGRTDPIIVTETEWPEPGGKDQRARSLFWGSGRRKRKHHPPTNVNRIL